MLLNSHTHVSREAKHEIYNQQGDPELKPFFSFGWHPWTVATPHESSLNELENILRSPGCVALGECGLDSLKGPDLKTQEEVFKLQVMLADIIGLPVIIHCVRAWNQLKKLKKEIQPATPWVWHGFNRASIIEEVIAEGIHISLGHDLLTNSSLQEAIKRIPIEYIMLETDDRNIPVRDIYGLLSELKELPLSDLEEQIKKNVEHIFPLWRIG